MISFKQFLENTEDKSDLDKAKDVANNIAKILQCKKVGTCMAFATWFTKVALKKGITNFIVVEGWVKYKQEDNWRQHTWIEMNGEKIDPTFDQFSHYSEKPSYVSKVKARYTPEEYLTLDKKYPLSKSDWKDAITESLAQFLESQNKKQLVGTCVNSFDEDGHCDNINLPYRDTTQFAQSEENATEITKDQFINNVNLPDSLKYIKAIYLHDKDNDVYMLYDDQKDVHYFFV